LALVHTSIEHSRDWCRSLLILNCQELAAQQPLRPINWCSRLLKMTFLTPALTVQETVVCWTLKANPQNYPISACFASNNHVQQSMNIKGTFYDHRLCTRQHPR